MLKEIEAGAVLENCRALISQINAGLSAEEPFVNVLTEFFPDHPQGRDTYTVKPAFSFACRLSNLSDMVLHSKRAQLQ